MATFESKYNLGDSVWTVVDRGYYDKPEYHVWENKISEIQFTTCPCCPVWYLADEWEEPEMEKALISTLEEALAKHLPADAKFYILHKIGKNYEKGKKVVVKNS